MRPRDEELDRIVEETLNQIRESVPDRQFEREATQRVWQLLQAECRPATETQEIRSCADFQALIDPYLRLELSPARTLLVRDHLGECVRCRRELKQLRAARERTSAAAPARAAAHGWGARLGWRAVAAAVIFVAVWGLSFKTDVLSFESGGFVRVDSVEGEVFRLTDQGSVPLSPGDTLSLEEGEGIRTARGSSAVLRLADESQVEMRERSELTVRERNYLVPGRRDDGVIDLERGSIIVEASDQGAGHLYVGTQDCRVAVTGTVFSVNHGIKGSRVSVIEGTVQVDYGGTEALLTPGQQTTTSVALETIPVEQEIAWSQKHDHYVALLREMQVLSREIEQVLQPGQRHSTDLLDLVPADTVLYVAMPNVANGLAEAWELLQSRVSTNPILKEWWESHEEIDAARIGEIFEKIRAYGDQLGEEILLSVSMTGGEMGEPLFLARVTGAQAFLDMLAADAASIPEDGETGPWCTRIEGALPAAAAAGRDHPMFFWVEDDLLAVTPSFQTLRVLDSIKRGQYASLEGGVFHDRLARRYEEGVEWLVGVNVETILESAVENPTLEALGFADVQHVIAERRQQGERMENQVDVTFAQPRRRMAAWLAEPAPLGSLDYVSPDASFVAAFAMQDLGTLVDELFEIIGTKETDFREELERFESEKGIDVRRDIAAPLGGEFALALDGPLLPKPSWKLVLEVYDPTGLEQTIEWVVGQLNQVATEHGAKGLTLDREEAAGRNYIRIVSLDTGIEVHLAIDGGYAVATPSRALLDRALLTHATGIGLVDSPAFRELLPRDGQVNFSGVFYHNLGPVLGPLADTFRSLAGAGSPDPTLFQAVAADTGPSLALVYGEKYRISVVGSSDGGFLSSGLSSLASFGSLLGMQQSFIQTLTDEARSQEDVREQ